MAKQGPIAVDPSAMVELVHAAKYECDVITERLTAIKGTQAERIAQSKAFATDALSSWYPLQETDPFYLLPFMTESELVSWCESMIREVNHSHEEMSSWWLVSNKSADATEAEVLTARYDELVTKAKSMVTSINTLIECNVLPEDTEVPDFDVASSAPKTTGSRSKSSPVKVSGASYYTVIGGTKNTPSAGQNNLSSIASYKGAELLALEDDKGNKLKGQKFNPGVKALQEAIRAKGIDPKQSTNWECVLPGGTVGMEVLSND